MIAGQSAGAFVEQMRRQLSEEFPGWRVGRGGSGRWWAVLDSVLVRAATAEELRAHLHAATDGREQVAAEGTQRNAGRR